MERKLGQWTGQQELGEGLKKKKKKKQPHAHRFLRFSGSEDVPTLPCIMILVLRNLEIPVALYETWKTTK